MMSEQILTLTLLILRLGGFVTFLPVFNDGRLPRTVKVGLAFGLAWLLHGGSLDQSRLAVSLMGEQTNSVKLVIAVIGELTFGASLGFALGLMFEPARIAGAYISQEIGLTMAELTDPTTQRSTNAVTQMFESWAILLFFIFNLHHLMLQLIDTSLLVHPLGQGFVAISGVAAAHHTDLACQWGLLVASPVGITSFLTVVSLGLMMRAVPQLNIFAIGITIRLAVGLVSLIVFLPVLLRLIHQVLMAAINSPDLFVFG